MATETRLDEASRRALAKRYAGGELTIQEVRRAGHPRMIELFADLAHIGERPPLAAMVGPNIDTRLAGMARLSARLRP